MSDPSSGSCIWYDCTDVIRFVEAGNRHVTGIQRVVINSFLAAYDSAQTVDVRPVLADPEGLNLVAVSSADILALFRTLQSGEVNGVDLRNLSRRARRSGMFWAPQPGDTLLIMGAYWIHDASLLLRLRQISGLQIVPFIHDVLIWRYPELFPYGDRSVFVAAFVEMLSMSSTMLTSSRYVADEIAAAAAAFGLRHPPIGVIGMATEPPTCHSGVPGCAIAGLAGKRFVLCVGTVEPRKNHGFALDLWDRVIAECGDAAPMLVFAGKQGWQVERLFERIASLHWAYSHLLHLVNVDDDDLCWLYRHCLFTLYPSLAEGWGLPVSESLAFHVPCVAARTPALMEAGGNLAQYFDPFDLEDGWAVVRPLISSADARRALREDIVKAPVRNKDVLYVSNAPIAEIQKFVNIVSSIVIPAITVQNATAN